jgi:hypothetical protein
MDPRPDSLRSLATDLLGVTQEPAASAIRSRLQRARDVLVATSGGGTGACLADVAEILQVAMQPPSPQQTAVEATR